MLTSHWKKHEWRYQLQASEVYLYQVSVTVHWTLSTPTNWRRMTSHSLPVIRNELSSRCFLTCAKPEHTLTCKVRRNNFPRRQFIFTDGGGTAHCTLTTTPGLQDWAVIVWDAQPWDLLYKLKVSNRKWELVIYSRAAKAAQESAEEKKGFSQHSETKPGMPWNTCLRNQETAFRKEVFKHKYIYQACLEKKKKTTKLDSRQLYSQATGN